MNNPDGIEERQADADERAARDSDEREYEHELPCNHVPYASLQYGHQCMYCNELFIPKIEPITARPVDAELLIRLAVERLEMT